MSFNLPIPTDRNIKTLPNIMVQFSFSNVSLVPSCIEKLKHIDTKESETSTSGTNGVQIIEPTERISAEHLIKDLSVAGYSLLWAYSMEKPNSNGKKPFGIVRFIFSQKDTSIEEFQKTREQVLSSLDTFLHMAYWRIRCYRNYSLEKGYFGSFNFDARVPRYDGENTDLPIRSRKRDLNGQQVGNPILVEPSGFLRVLKNEVTIHM